MADLFKRPDIDYKPVEAERTPTPPAIEGDTGGDQSAAEAVNIVNALISELKQSAYVVEGSLSEYSVNDKTGTLQSRAAAALGTEIVPENVSYTTYAALRVANGGDDVRQAFSDKSLSVWGNVSVAILDSYSIILQDAFKAKSILENIKDEDPSVRYLADWAGEARDFVYDVEKIANATISEDLVDEISKYSDEPIGTQKAVIVGASSAADRVKKAISGLSTVSGSESVYIGVGSKPNTVSVKTTGLIGSMVEKYDEIVNEAVLNGIDSLDFKTEVFKENSKSLFISLAELKIAQMTNAKLIDYGAADDHLVSDLYVSSIVDTSYDESVISGITGGSGTVDQGTSVFSVVSDVIENWSAQQEPVSEWHTKDIHDLLLIDAATLGGIAPNGFATSDHNHNTAYLGITAKAADADKLDGVDSTGYATSGHNHTGVYLPIAGTAADSDKLDGNHASAFSLDGHTHSYVASSHTDAPSFQSPSYSNNWTDYASGYQTGRYWKDAHGYVWIQATLKNSNTSTAGASTIFTLPAGYRPASSIAFTCGSKNGASQYAIVQVNVLSSGVVELANGYTSGNYLNLYCAFYVG